MIRLILLIGLPGSGKSTLANFLVSETWKEPPAVAVSLAKGNYGNGRLGEENFRNTWFGSSPWQGEAGWGQKHSQPRQLISTDAIRAQLFVNEATQGSWLKIWLEVRSRFQQAATDPNLDFAIYDATNAVRKQRRAAIALARKSGFTHVTGIWVNPPLEICLERNRMRSRQVPEEVIYRMARRLYGAPPAIEEGLDEVLTFS